MNEDRLAEIMSDMVSYMEDRGIYTDFQEHFGYDEEEIEELTE